ncbi:MAG: hypothetical protein CXT77_01525 [uncultured DHVE6 group euryarchaeote]|nr:MAG: hypothetical protein CXT77_01525 [uncultured DHVE6 group euryarchaeote]
MRLKVLRLEIILLKQYDSGEKEISVEDYTGSEAELGIYSYLNLFTAASDGETYLAPNTRLRRKGSSESVLGKNVLFTWNLNKILNLTTNYSKTVRELTELGKSLLLIWRAHNNLDLQKGTSLEDIT